MLSAVSLDGNNGMYPLEKFICDCENKENWIIFLNQIKDRLLEHPAPLTFISDRQKGLVPALEEVFHSSKGIDSVLDTYLRILRPKATRGLT